MTRRPTSAGNPIRELDVMIDGFRVPKFRSCPLEVRRDAIGHRIAAFSDGVMGYYLPIREREDDGPAHVPEINPWQDEIFFLVNNMAALILHGNSREIFLLHLQNYQNSPLVSALSKNRAALLELLKGNEGKIRVADLTLAAIEAMPVFKNGHEATFIIPELWSPELITERLQGETEDAFQKRIGRITDPIQTRETIQSMPDILQKTLTGPGVILKSILLFTSFYRQASPDKRRVIEMAHEKAREKRVSMVFINAFSACETGWEMGDIILNVVEQANAVDILLLCEKLFMLQRDLLSTKLENVAEVMKIDLENDDWKGILERMREKLNKNVFGTVIARQRAELLRQAAAGMPLDEEIFDPDNVFWGAIFRGLVYGSETEDLPGDVESVLGSFETTFRNVEGSTDLLVSDTPEAMDDPDNYRYPKRFNVDDYRRLVQFLHETYDEIEDQDYRDYLIRQIPRDLTNSDVLWTLIRKKGKLAGSYKTKPKYDENGEKIPGVYYSGTFYVSSELQKFYAVGEAIRAMNRSQRKDLKKLVFDASVCNTALELHIDKRGAVGLTIASIQDEIGETGDLLFMERDEASATLPSKKLNKEVIKNMAMDTDQSGPIKVFKVSSEVKDKAAFRAFLKAHLKEGRLLTRFFYLTKEGKPDRSQTYIGFEEVGKKDSSA